ncbi:EIF1AD [Cordylochernes scorpioides]|uniref:Probable RNA-binding protein EIF1AD n=1 Tax=Cordylochernes scorpioides TaxID=51811 RepID=A0ABY6K520_9ARAC|nr:EIF1AD [Cordylochernes scorpioides]
MSSYVNKLKRANKEYVSYFLPEGNQSIVQVVECRANNLHMVATPEGDRYLASMPKILRNMVWLRRGQYLIVEPVEEGREVKAIICHVLFQHHIEHIADNNLWPKEFSTALNPKKSNCPLPLPPCSSDEEEEEEKEEDSFQQNSSSTSEEEEESSTEESSTEEDSLRDR